MEDPEIQIIKEKVGSTKVNGVTGARETIENGKEQDDVKINGTYAEGDSSLKIKSSMDDESKRQQQTGTGGLEVTTSQLENTPEASGKSPSKSGQQSKGKMSPPSESDSLAQWWQSRRQGSPRKYHQGLKQTGLLMNSPKTYPIMASPSKKKTTPQNSPEKGSSKKVLFRQVRGNYLDSLMIVLETVMSQPQDVALLGEEDVRMIEKFNSLSLSSQKLYVRLLQRKLDLKRLSKVVYEDVCEPEDMGKVAQELVEAGFLLKGEARLSFVS